MLKNICKLNRAIEKIRSHYYTEYPDANYDLLERAIELDIANLKLAEENRILRDMLNL